MATRRDFLSGLLSAPLVGLLPDLGRFASCEDFLQGSGIDSRYPRGDVRRYGARGDGVTSDTVAIQAAIDDSGVVCFPAGVYRVSSLELKP